MTTEVNWKRRKMLALSVVSAALLSATATFPALAAFEPGTKLTFWGGLIFSDEANRLLEDTVNKWGADNGVETSVVMINVNETVQKVSAAVQSGSMPDVLDLTLDLLAVLAQQDLFVPLDDLYGKIGAAQGGWFAGIDQAAALAEGRMGIPYGITGNLLLRRTDLLDAAGYPEAPKTWDELVEQAAAVTKESVFGLGLALSNNWDANLQISILQSYGGRIGDAEGKNSAIDSEATRVYLAWLKNAWDKGVFSPGATTWDGAGDNQAYLSGQAAFIANTGSVGIAASTQDPELFEATGYSALPSGPLSTISPLSLQLRAIPSTASNVEAAKALIEHLSQPEFISAYYAAAIYGPVLQNQAAFETFDGRNAIHSGLLDVVKNGTAPGAPDVYNPAYAEISSNFIIPKMAQRVVVDGWGFDEAIAEAHQQIQAIYDKYR
ncbi:MAG: extracellular solute-binding protein [Hyphomicrobiales bacterium]|nr:MAG: extracellular solute-binding protein [Hyphomicrobiales bacterium]